jgi:hypothetical protein
MRDVAVQVVRTQPPHVTWEQQPVFTHQGDDGA